MIRLKSVDLKKEKVESLVIPVCEDQNVFDDKIIISLIRKAKKIGEFKGDKDDEVVFYNLPEVKTERVIFMGLGKLEKIDTEALRATTGKAVKSLIKKKLSNVLIAVPLAKEINMKMTSILEAMLEGAYLGNHLFDKYKKEKKHKPVKKINFLVKPDETKKYDRLSSRVKTICQGTILAREWVSTPSNDKKPEHFTRSIVMLAEKENLKVTVLGEKELKQKKFGAIMAVAAGSRSKPRMVILEHNPKGSKKIIALVGKGVTFDSGGINLKPSAGMEEMKSDMSGAAAVAATLITAAKLKSGHADRSMCCCSGRKDRREDYKELFKSDFADLNNIGSTRYGGAITAALFLSEFVKDTRWAHIDIAGPAYAKKESAYCGAGGTGFGVRLICDLLDKL